MTDVIVDGTLVLEDLVRRLRQPGLHDQAGGHQGGLQRSEGQPDRGRAHRLHLRPARPADRPGVVRGGGRQADRQLGVHLRRAGPHAAGDRGPPGRPVRPHHRLLLPRPGDPGERGEAVGRSRGGRAHQDLLLQRARPADLDDRPVVRRGRAPRRSRYRSATTCTARRRSCWTRTTRSRRPTATTPTATATPRTRASSRSPRGDTEDRDPLNPFRFSGKRMDSGTAGEGETAKAMDMGARRYGPDLGQFLQEDMFQSVPGRPGPVDRPAEPEPIRAGRRQPGLQHRDRRAHGARRRWWRRDDLGRHVHGVVWRVLDQ